MGVYHFIAKVGIDGQIGSLKTRLVPKGYVLFLKAMFLKTRHVWFGLC